MVIFSNVCMCLCVATILCIVCESQSLLCYTRPCYRSPNNLCLKQCPQSSDICTKQVSISNTGQHTVTQASCSSSFVIPDLVTNPGDSIVDTDDDEYSGASPIVDTVHCNSEPRRCDNINSTNYEWCCCTTDYCNGWFDDAIILYPLLSLPRLFPLLPSPLLLQDSNVLNCEEYICSGNMSYPHCSHSYTSCGPHTSNHDYCMSLYEYDSRGLLVPVYKGCVYQLSVSSDLTIQQDACHIDNPLVPFPSQGVLFPCYCSGNYCNQNNTFTHVIKLLTYGRQECRNKGCQYDCRIIDNEPICQCPIGYELQDETHCKDIDECSRNHSICQQKCVNTEGSYHCTCFAGFAYDAEHGTCESIEGVFCWSKLCSTCGPLIRHHCSNSIVIPPEYNTLENQFCIALYEYNTIRDRWRPLQQSCFASITGKDLDCLKKTKCEFDKLMFNNTWSLTYRCCCRKDYCNNPSIPPEGFDRNILSSSAIIPAIIESTVSSVTAIRSSSSTTPSEDINTMLLVGSVGGVLCILLLIFTVIGTGLLVYFRRRWSIPKPVFEELLYKGMNTELYIGDINRTPKLIKLFNTTESWKWETTLLHTLTKSKGNKSCFILFNESCKCLYGEHIVGSLIGPQRKLLKTSLRGFLKKEVLTIDQMKGLISSVMEGLAYLHHSVGVEQIIHRFINSKSYMVTSDGYSCVLVDLEHTTFADTDSMDQANETRYLSPEALCYQHEDDSNRVPFDLSKCDVYALGLVVWEIMSRLVLDNEEFVEKYKLPFFEYVPKLKPTIEDMRRVVVTDMLTPTFHPKFTKQRDTALLVEVIKKCWYHDPIARPTMKLLIQQTNKIFNFTEPEQSVTTINIANIPDSDEGATSGDLHQGGLAIKDTGIELTEYMDQQSSQQIQVAEAETIV